MQSGSCCGTIGIREGYYKKNSNGLEECKKEEVVGMNEAAVCQKCCYVQDAFPVDGDDNEGVGPTPHLVVVEPEQLSSLSNDTSS
eukprot:10163368-Ditylum_brightwellii.AAC.1